MLEKLKELLNDLLAKRKLYLENNRIYELQLIEDYIMSITEIINEYK